MVDFRSSGVSEWLEEFSGIAASAPKRWIGADGPSTERMVDVQNISVSEGQVILHHDRPIYPRAGTLVMQGTDGRICYLELRLFWTRFSTDQTYHTVGVIRRAWTLPGKGRVTDADPVP
jgi:hypothetical protein